MIDYFQLVKKFHEVFNLPVGPFPINLDLKQVTLRNRLILEELSEYNKAVGEGDIVAIADALGDILWVVFGTLVEHGLPIDQIFKCIAESNMSKVDGYKDDSGKWIKPDNYKPVDLTWLENIR